MIKDSALYRLKGSSQEPITECQTYILEFSSKPHIHQSKTPPSPAFYSTIGEIPWIVVPTLLPKRHLKLHTYWLSIGWLLVATVIVLSLWPNPPSSPVDIPGIDKWGHFLAYFVLMSWFCFAYLHDAYLAIATRLALLGLVLELLQWLFGHRFFEIADMATNLFGILSGWVLARTRFSRLLEWTEQTILS